MRDVSAQAAPDYAHCPAGPHSGTARFASYNIGQSMSKARMHGTFDNVMTISRHSRDTYANPAGYSSSETDEPRSCHE
jgi:hypothetical protein